MKIIHAISTFMISAYVNTVVIIPTFSPTSP